MGDELKLTHSGRGVATARGQQWLQEGGGHGWVWRGRSLRRVSTACRGTAGPWVFRERGGQGPPGRTRRTPKLHQPGGVGEKAASSHRAEKKLVLGEAPCLGKKLKEGSEGTGQGRPVLVELSCGRHRVRARSVGHGAQGQRSRRRELDWMADRERRNEPECPGY